MSVNKQQYQKIQEELSGNATLVAVSKIQPVQAIQTFYDCGHRDFGENYVQELVHKYEQLPKDINWHFIGHLQSNKVKYIAPFIHLIHGIDSEKLLKEVNKQAAKNDRVINCLLQVHISSEETKFGFDDGELSQLLTRIENKELEFQHISINGLMGMASFTEDNDLIVREFNSLKTVFDKHFPATATLSMGMSADYRFALAAGSNMIRIGSLLFGSRI